MVVSNQDTQQALTRQRRHRLAVPRDQIEILASDRPSAVVGRENQAVAGKRTGGEIGKPGAESKSGNDVAEIVGADQHAGQPEPTAG